MEAQTMTDDQVEKMIWREIRKRHITLSDMIGVSNYVDDSNDKNIIGIQGTRRNRFKETMGCERIKEILCQGEKKQFDDYPSLKITFQDLFRFWFNRCIDKSIFADEVLEEIYQYFLEQMRPPEEKPATMDMSIDFEEVPLTLFNQKKAA
jgi:hypothetical protein